MTPHLQHLTKSTLANYAGRAEDFGKARETTTCLKTFRFF